MIESEEIKRKSEELGIHVANVQRDYVFGWLLCAVFSQTDLRDKLFLKGGNALRKCYFENTRYSGDIDFGMHGDLPKEVIETQINRACEFIQGKTGVQFEFEKTSVEEMRRAIDRTESGNLKIFETKVYFKEFFTHADHLTIKIEMDITRFDRPLLAIQQRSLIHPYSDANEMVTVSIPVMKLEEILATKLKCLLQREHAPDLFDIVYLDLFGRDISVNKEEIVSTFLRKTIFQNTPAVVKEILLETPFEFFRQYWKDVICAQSMTVEVDTAISTFNTIIATLFAGYTITPFDRSRFFGPKLRNPIIKAARNQTVLRIRYDGYDRIVEPYSLKYMQPRDKSPREYFFVWNCEGGSQATPGLRMFLPEKIEHIENTETKFSPQYVIELCKAGEPVEDPYLYDPSRIANRVARVRSPRLSTPKVRNTIFSYGAKRYTIKCPVCQKLFKRSQPYDTSLNSHKGKHGYDCYGTIGFPVR